MPVELFVWLVTLVFVGLLLTQRLWEHHLPTWRARLFAFPWAWLLLGYPVTVVRMRVTWRRLSNTVGLSVVKRPRYRVIGDQAVRGMALRPIPAWLGMARPTWWGLTVRVRLHPGQTPADFIAAADALAHAWRVHAARVTSPQRGIVLVTVIARDPLAAGSGTPGPGPARLLSARVGRDEDGGPWVMDLRREPHWLITGATQSGKSTLMAALVSELAAQAVAVVGIDCKGGLELSLFQRRLTALADSRPAAARLLSRLVEETEARMSDCRKAGVRSIWELPEADRPVPVVVLVDELAELYLSDGTRVSKDEVASCGTSLLRLAQLGAALGMHLVIAGQRVGSDLGTRVTALRAQLGGRICHRVHDEETAEMTLGDLAPDAVAVAQSITEDERGVAVTAAGGRWTRARSHLTSTDEARAVAARYADITPSLPDLSLSLSKGCDAR